MVDLVQWLTAQLDEDARIARAAHGPVDGPLGKKWWTPEEIKSSLCDDQIHMSDAEHIAVHDPARVLRKIDVDRELLAEYERLLRAHEAHRKEADRLAGSDDDPIRRNALRREADYLPAMLHVMERWAKQKAAVYSHRPGFREEWAL